MLSPTTIPLLKELQKKNREATGYHDAYFVDVLLQNGSIKYGLVAREKACLHPTAKCDLSEYNFSIEDIQDIRPALGFFKKLFDPWKLKT